MIATERRTAMPGNTIRLHRVLRAKPERVYRAFLDPAAMVKWLPPNGFTATVHHLDAKVGGTHKMSFTNFTTGSSYSFGGRYVELTPHQRIRYTDSFDDPNLPGEMQVTINLKQVSVGTELSIVQEGVPDVARLNHPHIVQVYDFGTEGELAYIVMEYIEGKELKDHLAAKEPFDLGAIFRMMGELLDALEFAHQAGVIHRDVKPANVMLDAGRRVKLTDFGVARITEAEGDSADMTRAGAMVGTPSYMSPEQLQGQPIDRRVDVFSAGVLFYQLLTGKKPFEGSGFALAKKIVQDDPAPPSSIMQIPPAIDRVVAKALAKAPGRRYQSAR